MEPGASSSGPSVFLPFHILGSASPSACLLILLALASCSHSGHVLNPNPKEPCVIFSTPLGRALDARPHDLPPAAYGGPRVHPGPIGSIQRVWAGTLQLESMAGSLSNLAVHGDIVQAFLEEGSLDLAREAGFQRLVIVPFMAQGMLEM